MRVLRDATQLAILLIIEAARGWLDKRSRDRERAAARRRERRMTVWQGWHRQS